MSVNIFGVIITVAIVTVVGVYPVGILIMELSKLLELLIPLGVLIVLWLLILLGV